MPEGENYTPGGPPEETSESASSQTRPGAVLPAGSNTEHQTPGMEVHHHSHTERKKWHHYFWEFFMLFLAVTLGFLVENQREHITDHKKEVQYVHSYMEDLHEDIKQLDSLLNYAKQRNEWMDSLSYLLDTPDPDIYGKDIYYYARMLTL